MFSMVSTFGSALENSGKVFLSFELSRFSLCCQQHMPLMNSVAYESMTVTSLSDVLSPSSNICTYFCHSKTAEGLVL